VFLGSVQQGEIRGRSRGMIEVKIREVCKSKGITTAYKLQKALNVQPSVAARLYKGDFSKIDLGTLNKLCNVLKCQPNKLLHFTPDLEDQ
jgi:DNA-binding Xre family transcriptional regulator